MDHNVLDRAIDEAAREMIAGEPSAAFRARVMERLHERRTPAWRSPRVLSAIAVTAAIVFGVVVSREGRRPLSVLSDGSPLPARPISLIAAVSGQDPIAIVAPPVVRRSPALTSYESVVTSLAPARLEVSSLGLATLDQGESLRLHALETIAPITVAPIGETQGEPR